MIRDVANIATVIARERIALERLCMLADSLIRWTARLFVACYILRLCVDAAGRWDAASQRLARWFWTMGCGIYMVHVLVAFHLMHGWSHEAAYEHVRQRTLHTTGLASGIGLYINYAFGVLWIADTLAWWRRLDWSERRVPYWIVQGIFAFLVSQATVALGPWFWTPISLIVLVGLVTL
jgi:hypothetical protein